MTTENTSPQSQDGQHTDPAAQNNTEETPNEKAIRLFGEMSDKNNDDKEEINESIESKKQDDPESKESKNKDDVGSDKKDEPKEEPSVSKAFAALAEKEARFQNEKRELKARAQELERKASETQATFDRIKRNPLAFLSELGLDLDSVLKAAANPEDAPKPDQANASKEKSEAQKLREELAAKEQHEAERKAIEEFSHEIASHISDNQEKYPMLLIEDKAQEQVLELIDGYFRQTGKVMPIDEASEMVESELRAMADKWAGGKYLQSKIASLKVNGSDGKSDGAKKKTESASLSNSLTPANALADLTEEQRIAMAIKMFAERSRDPADME